MKLREINGVAKNQEVNAPFKNLVLTAMEAAGPILQYAEFYSFIGTSDAVYPDLTTQIGAFRALNSPNVPSTTALGDPVNLTRKILSDGVKTDRALIDQHGENGDKKVGSLHENSLIQASKALGRYFQDLIINGDGTGNSITGLKTLITAGDQLISFIGANGGLLPFGNTDSKVTQQMKFLEALNKIIYAMNPTCLMMNSDLVSRLETIAMQWVRVTNVKDAFGENQKLVDYKGIPIVISGKKKDDSTAVINNAETCGESTDCTSLYAIKFAERDQVTLPTTETGLKVIHNPNKDNFVQTDVELQYDLSIIKAKAAVRLQGIRLD